MTSRQARSVYVHVPFCRHRCGYCNFALVSGRDYLVDRYLLALDKEIQKLFETHAVETVYLGGGTPTHLTDRQLTKLFESIQKKFTWSADAEITIEANPNDLLADRSATMKQLGINRVSLGVQSFRPEKLRRLDRDHDADQIYRAVENCKKFTDNISIDLIFAAPEESLSEWKADLDQIDRLPLTHVSTYELTYEKGTRFWTQRRKGLQDEADEDLRLAMYEAAIERFLAFGFEQYEISSFAKPGFRSRHNQVYWSGDDYWAFGPGASGYLGGVRYANVSSTNRYLQLIESDGTVRAVEEKLMPIDAARELLAIGLRQLDGLDETKLEIQCQATVEEIAGPAIKRLTDMGLVESIENRIRLTKQGKLFYDTVAVEILSGGNNGN